MTASWGCCCLQRIAGRSGSQEDGIAASQIAPQTGRRKVSEAVMAQGMWVNSPAAVQCMAARHGAGLSAQGGARDPVLLCCLATADQWLRGPRSPGVREAQHMGPAAAMMRTRCMAGGHQQAAAGPRARLATLSFAAAAAMQLHGHRSCSKIITRDQSTGSNQGPTTCCKYIWSGSCCFPCHILMHLACY